MSETDQGPSLINAGWLRALGAERLGVLLDRRPDALLAPVPGSLSELADRLNQAPSVLAALRRLDRPTLQIAEALAALGGQADRGALDRLVGVSGRSTTADADRALATLAGHGLLAGDDRLRLVDAARDAWPSPLDLGPPAAEVLGYRTADELRRQARDLGLRPPSRKAELLAAVLGALRDPEVVRRVVAGAPPAARELLLKVASTGEPVNDFSYHLPIHNRSDGPVAWAVSRGLLVRNGSWNAGLVVPAEAALALRGPDWTAPFDPIPPRPASAKVSAETVVRDAAAAGAGALRLVAALLDEGGRAPIALLKTGGVGLRELRRLAKRTDTGEAEVRLGLAVAHRADLLALSAEGYTPTVGYDEWLRAEPAQRLAMLLSAWWSLPYPPTDESDGGWQPVDRGDGTSQLRAAVLQAAVEVAGTDGVTGANQAIAVNAPEALAELALWRHPYAYTGPEPHARAIACWREAALLGAAGAGGPSPAGRALLSGGDLAASLTGLGSTERRVRLQADLSAVVGGTPSAELSDLLDGAADQESRGTASTWRFTPASVRRALDGGQQPDALLAELAAVAIGALPQPLEYLIRDVARRHGAVRGQEVACCLRSDDPALLAEIAADRRLRGLGLRSLAPTVLAGTKPLPETLAGLRAAGYAPLAETADGTPVLERVGRRRAETPARPARNRGTTRKPTRPDRTDTGRTGSTAVPPQPDAGTLAAHLLDRPDVVAQPASPTLRVVRAAARNLSEGQARLLADAIDAGQPVSIVYRNQAGNTSYRVIEEISLAGTTLLAWCRLREDERMFNLAQLLAIGPPGLIASEYGEPASRRLPVLHRAVSSAELSVQRETFVQLTTKSSRFGEPVPGLVTTLVVALLTR